MSSSARNMGRAGFCILVAAALLSCAAPAWGKSAKLSAEGDIAVPRILQAKLPGKAAPAKGGVDRPFDCTPGEFFNATRRQCELCPVGQWTAFRGALLCEACLSERTCCPGSTGPQDCVPLFGGCPPISACRVQPRGPLQCPPGTQWDGFSRTCQTCPRGFASEGLGVPCEYCEPPLKTCCAGESICRAKRAPCPARCPTAANPNVPQPKKNGPIGRK